MDPIPFMQMFAVFVPTLMFITVLSMINRARWEITKEGFESIVFKETEFKNTPKCSDMSEKEFFEYRELRTKILFMEFKRDNSILDLDKTLQQIMTLREMKDDMCLRAKKHNGIIFGGHVRDFISGDYVTTHDIDIMFGGDDYINSFVNELSDHYFVHQGKEHIKSKYARHSVWTWHIQHKTMTELSVPIDIVLNNALVGGNLGICVNDFDFDVNMLLCETNDKIDIMPHICHINKSIIYRHIIDKTYMLIPNSGFYTMFGILQDDHRTVSTIFDNGIEAYSPFSNKDCITGGHGEKIRMRIQKMNQRGWKLLTGPCDNYECVLCPKHVKDEKETKNKLIHDKIERELIENRIKEARKRQQKYLDDRQISYIKGHFILDEECSKLAPTGSYQRNVKSREIEQNKRSKQKMSWRCEKRIDNGHLQSDPKRDKGFVISFSVTDSDQDGIDLMPWDELKPEKRKNTQKSKYFIARK